MPSLPPLAAVRALSLDVLAAFPRARQIAYRLTEHQNLDGSKTVVVIVWETDRLTDE